MGAPLKIPSSLDRRAAIVGLGLIATLLLAGAVLLNYFYYLRPLQRSRAAQAWTPAPCRIIQCQITTLVSHGSHGHTSTTYNLTLAYAYLLGDRTYQSGDYDFTLGSTSDYNWWAGGASRFKPGTLATCYVNPQNPAQAVLVRDFDHNPVMLMLPLGLAAAGLAIASVPAYRTLRRIKFGESVLEMRDAPAVLGGPLTANIALSRSLQPAEGFALKLSNVQHIVTGTGKGRHVEESILWQDEKRADANLNDTVSVAFTVPRDAEATDTADADNRTFWRLHATAKLPGVDYAAEFEVPVVAAPRPTAAPAASNPPSEAAALAAARRAAGWPDPARPLVFAGSDDDAHYQQPAHSRIRVRDTDAGKEFYFPAFRNRGAAVTLGLFTLFWSGVVWLLIDQHAPLLFPVVFGFFDVILVLWTLHEWFATTRVVAGRGGLTLTKHLLGLGRTRALAAADLSQINIVHGETYNNIVLYNIQIVRQNGSLVTAGDEIPDAHEAHWLALEMARCAGVGRG
jgi:hypothetical protein